jgi:hypothetical protein
MNSKDNTETKAYEMLMKDSARDMVPEFFREVEYNGECILLWSFKLLIHQCLGHLRKPS